MEEGFMTPEEIAAELRISQETVRGWCRSGKLNATKAGRQWRIKRGDLLKFLEEVKEQAKKADGLVVHHINFDVYCPRLM